MVLYCCVFLSKSYVLHFIYALSIKLLVNLSWTEEERKNETSSLFVFKCCVGMRTRAGYSTVCICHTKTIIWTAWKNKRKKNKIYDKNFKLRRIVLEINMYFSKTRQTNFYSNIKLLRLKTNNFFLGLVLSLFY